MANEKMKANSFAHQCQICGKRPACARYAGVCDTRDPFELSDEHGTDPIDEEAAVQDDCDRIAS